MTETTWQVSITGRTLTGLVPCGIGPVAAVATMRVTLTDDVTGAEITFDTRTQATYHRDAEGRWHAEQASVKALDAAHVSGARFDRDDQFATQTAAYAVALSPPTGIDAAVLDDALGGDAPSEEYVEE